VGVVSTLAAAECLQLCDRVFRVLSREPRELRGYARPRRTVTGGAGCHAPRGDTAAIDRLAELDELLIARGARLRLLAFEPGRDVAHVVGGKRGSHPGHDRVRALRWLAVLRLEVRELLGGVVGVLPGQNGIGRRRAVPVGTVTGAAH